MRTTINASRDTHFSSELGCSSEPGRSSKPGRSFKPGGSSELGCSSKSGRSVRRSTASLLSAVLLLALGGTASAEEQSGTPTDADGAPAPETAGAATVGAETAGSETAGPESAGPESAGSEKEAEAPAASSAGASAVADEADPSCETPATEGLPLSSEGIATESVSPVQSRALWPLSWKKTPGQGFSFGIEEGLWGNSWSQGLRVTIPFTKYLGTTLRGVYLIDMASDTFAADAGGRIDLFGRSPVMLNVVRLYGGGGVQVLAPAADTSGRTAKVGVGGHFGFEFFHNPHFSYFLEVGGQGGEPSPGATVVAGLMFYPWTR